MTSTDKWRTFIAAAFLCVQPLFSAEPQSTDSATSISSIRQANSDEIAAVPTWVPVPIPQPLYQKWRKYGEWDYKQQGFKYRDATLFNFGATASAANLDLKSIDALTEASKPTREDVDKLDDPALQAKFELDAEAFEKLRIMAEQDAHVIRIAPDFTLLDTNNKWPREDIGFSEARWSEYRGAFKKLELPEGIVRTEDFPSAIFFLARVKGMCVGGSSAGYVYSTRPLTPTAKSPKVELDAEARRNPGRQYAYVFKPLRTNWYTFYEIDW